MTQNSPLQFAAAVLAIYDLPNPIHADYVTGGLLHRLLRVQTDSTSYALKMLSPRSTQTPQTRLLLEQSEAVAAQALQAGVPALVGIKGPDSNVLQNVQGQWVILYPWLEGQILPPTAATPAHCAVMGEHLARLHSLQIRFPNQQKPIPEAFEVGHFLSIARRAEQQNASWASRVRAVIEELEAINSLAMHSQLQLQEGWVTGHLDCDQKNVLWQNDSPTILDWESAKPIHPALEAMGAGLSWAGQSAGDSHFDSFAAFFRSYLGINKLQPEQLELAVDAVLGKWIIWLEFNLQRLLDKGIQGTHEEQIAFDAGMHALGATLKLNQDGALYKQWIHQLENYVCIDSQS